VALSRGDLKSIHKHCIRHRDQVQRSRQCGCFYCLATFTPGEIRDWVDPPDSEENEPSGVTALCPRCGIDAVLPDDIPGAPITASLLAEMRCYWFDKSSRAK
jgi:hypothetical protein